MSSQHPQNGSKRFSIFLVDTSQNATPDEVITSSVRLRDNFRDQSISQTRQLNLHDSSSTQPSDLNKYIDLLANPDPSAVHTALQSISSTIQTGFLFYISSFHCLT